jgi:hypothetical protein
MEYEGKQMTAKVLEKMMLVIKWAQEDDICDQFRGQGCLLCPLFVKDAPCGKTSTKWILKCASEAFQEYFDTIDILVNGTQE